MAGMAVYNLFLRARMILQRRMASYYAIKMRQTDSYPKRVKSKRPSTVSIFFRVHTLMRPSY